MLTVGARRDIARERPPTSHAGPHRSHRKALPSGHDRRTRACPCRRALPMTYRVSIAATKPSTACLARRAPRGGGGAVDAGPGARRGVRPFRLRPRAAHPTGPAQPATPRRGRCGRMVATDAGGGRRRPARRAVRASRAARTCRRVVGQVAGRRRSGRAEGLGGRGGADARCAVRIGRRTAGFRAS